MKTKNITLLFAILTLLVWSLWSHHPHDLSPQGWHMLLIFVATIIAVISNIMPMGLVTTISIIAVTITGIFPLQTMLAGFASDVVWLVVAAFTIARAIIKTGLGQRIAEFFIQILGKTPLGLSYGTTMTELLVSPAIPSATARVGGIIYPIVHAIVNKCNGGVTAKSNNISKFFMLNTFHTNVITSSMFLTAMAGNPLIVGFASAFNIEITWMKWTTAAALPGFMSLLVLPLILYMIYRPKLSENIISSSQELIKKNKISWQEIITALVFIGLIIMWSCEDLTGIKTTTAALLACVILICSGVLEWQDFLKERGSWETLLWFGAMISLAGGMKATGIVNWISDHILAFVQGYDQILSVTILCVTFFIAHCFFASTTVYMTVMYSAFLGSLLVLGISPMVATMMLACFSILSAGLTHYGIGSAPIIFGSNCLTVGQWWGVSFIVTFFYMIVWILTAFAWWYFLGWI